MNKEGREDTNDDLGSLDENAKPATTRNYILRSILDSKYNEPELIKRKDEDYESMGILYVILALIFTNERAMHDGKMAVHIKLAMQLTFSTTSESQGAFGSTQYP